MKNRQFWKKSIQYIYIFIEIVQMKKKHDLSNEVENVFDPLEGVEGEKAARSLLIGIHYVPVSSWHLLDR